MSFVKLALENGGSIHLQVGGVDYVVNLKNYLLNF